MIHESAVGGKSTVAAERPPKLVACPICGRKQEVAYRGSWTDTRCVYCGIEFSVIFPEDWEERDELEVDDKD